MDTGQDLTAWDQILFNATCYRRALSALIRVSVGGWE